MVRYYSLYASPTCALLAAHILITLKDGMTTGLHVDSMVQAHLPEDPVSNVCSYLNKHIVGVARLGHEVHGAHMQ